ncbi:MAG: hypothetical protein EBZ44_06290 [Verrucomicrobia bacterium]|nr:hypothetical protein [Verrucomicrobiota bacterium]
MAVASPPKNPSSPPGGAQASKAGSGKYFFLGKYRSLLTVCLILAAGVHVLGLLIFGTITLFKGSVPRMPFTSEGIPAEDVGAEAPMEEESAPAEEAASSPDSAAASSEALGQDGASGGHGILWRRGRGKGEGQQVLREFLRREGGGNERVLCRRSLG